MRCVFSILFSFSLLFSHGANALEHGAEPAAEYIDPITGMEFVYIPGGWFIMGRPNIPNKPNIANTPTAAAATEGAVDEMPHRVWVDDFYMGKYEVTNAQFRIFRPSHNSLDLYSGEELNGENQPVIHICWQDAQEYIAWLSQKSGKQYRLPTEAEWEYAAQGTFFQEENNAAVCRYANIADHAAQRKWHEWPVFNCDDGYVMTAPVGSFAPNRYGLYDMLGNVREWCVDWYAEDSSMKNPRKNPQGAKKGGFWVVRGGGWSDGPGDIRGARREKYDPSYADINLGFRLVLPVD